MLALNNTVFTPAQWSVNTARMKTQLVNHFVRALKRAEQQLIQLMKEQMPSRVYGDGPGDPDWIKAMLKDIKEVYKDVATNYIEVGVGLPYEEGTWQAVRAMVVEAGAGSAAGNPPIQTRPRESVWNDDLTGKHESEAKSWYYLPDAFNQEGNQWVENAMKLMAKYFDDIMEDACNSVPASIFYNNITSRRG